MRKGTRLNEYGTVVGVYECETCGEEFTVCPDPRKEEGWEHYLSNECESYDPARDADKYFEDPDTEVKRRPSPRCN